MTETCTETFITIVWLQIVSLPPTQFCENKGRIEMVCISCISAASNDVYVTINDLPYILVDVKLAFRNRKIFSLCETCMLQMF